MGLEDILGFSIENDRLYINPCIPGDWEGFKINYRYKNTLYKIEVKNIDGVNKGIKRIIIDGESAENSYIELADDKLGHYIVVEMGQQ